MLLDIPLASTLYNTGIYIYVHCTLSTILYISLQSTLYIDVQYIHICTVSTILYRLHYTRVYIYMYIQSTVYSDLHIQSTLYYSTQSTVQCYKLYST